MSDLADEGEAEPDDEEADEHEQDVQHDQEQPVQGAHVVEHAIADDKAC